MTSNSLDLRLGLFLAAMIVSLHAHEIGVPYLSEPMDSQRSFTVLPKHKILIQERLDTLRFYDLESGVELSNLGFESLNNSKILEVTIDEKYIFTSKVPFAGEIFQWNLKTRQLEHLFEVKECPCKLNISDDGSNIVMAFSDHIHIIDTKSGKETNLIARKMILKSTAPEWIYFSKDLKYLFSQGYAFPKKKFTKNDYDHPLNRYEHIKMIEIRSGQEVAFFERPEDVYVYETIIISLDYLILNSLNRLQIYDINTKKIKCDIERKYRFDAISLIPDRNQLLYRDKYNTILRFDIESCRIDKTYDFNVSDGVTKIASALDANQSNIWELFGYEIIAHNAGYPKSVVTELALLRERNWLIVGDSEGVVQIFSLSPIERIAQFKSHTDEITVIEPSDDERYIVTGSKDQTLKLWDLESKRLVHTFTGHEYPLVAVTFTPDGNFISGDDELVLNFWDIQKRSLIKTDERYRFKDSKMKLRLYPPRDQFRWGFYPPYFPSRFIDMKAITSNVLVLADNDDVLFVDHETDKIKKIIAGYKKGYTFFVGMEMTSNNELTISMLSSVYKCTPDLNCTEFPNKDIPTNTNIENLTFEELMENTDEMIVDVKNLHILRQVNLKDRSIFSRHAYSNYKSINHSYNWLSPGYAVTSNVLIYRNMVIFATGRDIRFYDIDQKKMITTIRSQSDDWIAIDADGNYSGSEAGYKQLNILRSLWKGEAVSLDEMNYSELRMFK